MMTIDQRCAAVRGALMGLGEPGRPLVAVVDTVAARFGAQRVDALADPTVALALVREVGATSAAALHVGPVLALLRDAAALEPAPGRVPVALSDVVARYEASSLALMARGTQHT